MDSGLDKVLALINGQSPTEYENAQMTDADRAQIDNALEVLFSGLSLRNWLSGGTLGDAWTGALDTLRDMVFSISEVNVASRYARAATFKRRAKWLNKINLTLHVNRKIQCTESERPSWLADANAKIENGIEILRRKISEFSSGTLHKPTTPDFTPVFKQVFQEKTAHAIERENEHIRKY